jgi:hypothetical protein
MEEQRDQPGETAPLACMDSQGPSGHKGHRSLHQGAVSLSEDVPQAKEGLMTSGYLYRRGVVKHLPDTNNVQKSI